MKTTFLIATAALALATVGQAATPATPDEHAAHHPAGAVAAPKVDTAKVDQQMKMMQGMHEKMMTAKTPEERAALMQAHMKAMQDGMAMMGQMRASMGAGMPMGDKMGGMEKSSDKGMAMDHDLMHRRMDMMEAMMQMMMDRQEKQAPAK
ncbi:MAG: hypothetical protein ABI859_10100 [Pseudomonadota bacterium]